MYNDFSVCPNSHFMAYLRHYYFWVGYYYVLCVIMDMSTLQSLLYKSYHNNTLKNKYAARTIRITIDKVAIQNDTNIIVYINKKLKFIISAVE